MRYLRFPVAAIVCLLLACGEERPAYRVRMDPLADLKQMPTAPVPEVSAADTDDEAEIQFRAGIVFYKTRRWQYAAAAFAEALDYNEDRHDIRYLLAASLLLATRDEEAVEHLEELLDTPFETRARRMLAPLYLRMGHPDEAREAIAPAAETDYDSAGWLARFDALLPSIPGARKPVEEEDRKLRTLKVRADRPAFNDARAASVRRPQWKWAECSVSAAEDRWRKG